MREKVSAEDRVREIRRKTRKKYSAEEKVRIVLEGLGGAKKASQPCTGGKGSHRICITGGARSFSKREATSSEVTELRQENEQLKQAVAEMLLKNRFPEKP